MRMRKKKNRDSRFQACSHLHIAQPELNKGKWNEVFGNENKIRLEIGCGKGDFITALAQREPDVNFIAIEKCMDVIILAMEKVQRAEIKNVRFMWADAANLLEVFEEIKNTTHCSTGCGGCYDKVIAIISDSLTTGKK